MNIDFYKTNNINLDLALEAHDIVRGQLGQEIPGVILDKERYNNAAVTTVKIVEDYAEQIMGKPRGNYITIDAPALRDNSREAHKDVANILAQKLNQLINLPENANILLVGLGNWQATPDSLGPKVIEHSLVTRHMYNYAPAEIKPGMRSVSAISPGVLGITGIETAEIIKGVVEKIRPELMIVVDALAAGSVERIATTIQIADTGVSPGSGVGNKRTGINQATMGIPVIAIGVPTVVNAALIAQVTLEHFVEQIKDNKALVQLANSLNPAIYQQAISRVLEPFGGDLTVTPKEIDSLISSTSKTVAGGISMALHPAINADEYAMYLN